MRSDPALCPGAPWRDLTEESDELAPTELELANDAASDFVWCSSLVRPGGMLPAGVAGDLDADLACALGSDFHGFVNVDGDLEGGF